VEVPSGLNYSMIIAASLSVLMLISFSLLQKSCLGFLKQGQLEGSSLINSFVGGM